MEKQGIPIYADRSGSVDRALDWGRGVSCSSLQAGGGVTVNKTLYPLLSTGSTQIVVHPKKTHTDLTEKSLTGT